VKNRESVITGTENIDAKIIAKFILLLEILKIKD